MMDRGQVLHQNIAMTYLQVLVVDDSPITVAKLSRMLQTLGHRVLRTASNGAEAITAYETYKPDVVTMDITMPDMNGIEATRRIRARFPEAQIIMVTSHGQEKMVLEALKAGAKGYLLKPFNEEKLQKLLETAIKRTIDTEKLQEVIHKVEVNTPAR